ncbi:hypothetical protein [Lewinella sp. IMCC34191]|uniref:hypothetical protein n=1 Tax=Lewinella sp. IMCC34191 TaxID=2259172 RepID=UPI000E262C73|nr:hypothetical protein [Lewinella sp. IMCC34191]
MNLESAKHTWQQINTDATAQLPPDQLQVRWSHPALDGLRRQLVFEGACWIIFLAVFYTGLDGDQRPIGWTVALALGLLLLIAHAVAGYRLAARPIGAEPVREAISRQIGAIRSYSRVSIILRTLTLLILFGFLLSNVPDLWQWSRFWVAGAILAFTAITLFVQFRFWRSRMRKLKDTLHALDVEE